MRKALLERYLDTWYRGDEVHESVDAEPIFVLLVWSISLQGFHVLVRTFERFEMIEIDADGEFCFW